MTPLMVAASRDNVEIVRALLANCAGITKTDYTRRNAAAWASESYRLAVAEAIKRMQTAKNRKRAAGAAIGMASMATRHGLHKFPVGSDLFRFFKHSDAYHASELLVLKLASV
jgi:hypothetical protein